MSNVKVVTWDEQGESDPENVEIVFNPPLKAYMKHELDNGDMVDVLADISGVYPASGQYAFEYVDPENDQMAYIDGCSASELRFVITGEI